MTGVKTSWRQALSRHVGSDPDAGNRAVDEVTVVTESLEPLRGGRGSAVAVLAAIVTGWPTLYAGPGP